MADTGSLGEKESSLLKSVRIAIKGDRPVIYEPHLHRASYHTEQLGFYNFLPNPDDLTDFKIDSELPKEMRGTRELLKRYEIRDKWGKEEDCPYSKDLHDTIESLINKGYLSRDSKDPLLLHILKLV